MSMLAPYRDASRVKDVSEAIASIVSKPHTIMEICGGQTHAIMRYGLDKLLPEAVDLVHGPGCPVCVTSIGDIDHAIELAGRTNVILCSFGDMLRVPGHNTDLRTARAEGADVRIVYSPTDALEIAEANPARQVVLFAIGFETTAPATAMAAYAAKQRGLTNFSMLVSHVLVPPAIRALLSSEDNRVQGFLAAGHVCTVMGTDEYVPLAKEYGIPIVVTGFEPLDIMQGAYLLLKQLEEGRCDVENAYRRTARQRGNPAARSMIDEVFSVTDRVWRGFGVIPASGLVLARAYEDLDAARRFSLSDSSDPGWGACGIATCRAGDVLRGLIKPDECAAFGQACQPDSPLGAPMVSSEGACAAYYRYRGHGGADA